MSESLVLQHIGGAIVVGGLLFDQRAFPVITQQQIGGSGSSSFAQFSLSRPDSFPFTNSQSTSGAGLVIPTLASITGSTSSQSINIATTSFITEFGYWIIDGGTTSQEVVVIDPANIVDATHVTCIVQKSHAAGAPMLKVYSVFTKYLLTTFHSVPGTGISNYNFIRYSALPANVYDQYYVFGSFGSPMSYFNDDVLPWVNGYSSTPTISSVPNAVPQYSSGSVSGTGNPTNGVSIYSSTVTTSSNAYPNVQVQFLCTTYPEPDTSGILYRYWWDDN